MFVWTRRKASHGEGQLCENTGVDFRVREENERESREQHSRSVWDLLHQARCVSEQVVWNRWVSCIKQVGRKEEDGSKMKLKEGK